MSSLDECAKVIERYVVLCMAINCGTAAILRIRCVGNGLVKLQ